MKKILLYTLMTVAAAGMTACEDFLTRDTYDQIGSDEFWKSETDLELYANGFIQKMIPGDGTITRGDIDADYCAVDIATDLLRPDGNVSPDNQGGWTESSWTNLRRVNYMLDNMHRCRGRVSDEVYNHYEGVARFWRAWFYYDKVRTFGAVPWYDFTISASDKEALTKPRDSREYVMDKVLEDLTFASTYCLADAKYTKGSALINKWVALAFKSRVTCKRKETQRMSKKITALIPGAALALGIACIAKWLETLESSAGLHLIGASVIALFIGMAINAFFQPNKTTAPGIKFTSKKVLKFAIVLLGASLNIRTVLTVGRFSLTVMLFTLATCFGLGALIGRALGLNWKTSSLINAGTGICGGSAIAAIAPVIEADDMDIAYGMSATFLFDTVMIVVFPLLGRWLGLSDAAFGLWAGTAVNDTSSVVATGYAFSEAAGDFATMVKLTRTLAIIPAVLVFAAINLHLKKKESAQANGVKVRIRSIFPWFILAFLAMSLLTSLGLLPAGLVSGLKTISKFLMVAALAAIGLNTNFKSLCRSGAKPMLHGFIISTLVVLVAIGVEYMIGIAPYGTL